MIHDRAHNQVIDGNFLSLALSTVVDEAVPWHSTITFVLMELESSRVSEYGRVSEKNVASLKKMTV